AGAIIESTGIYPTYFLFCISIAISTVPLLLLHYERQKGGRRASVQAALEGLRYVRRQQAVLGAMTLDMFAVIFGGAAALLPIYARDILKVGPSGFGILTSSMTAGGMLASLLLVFRPAVRHSGRVLVFSVVVYGVATMVFGLSRNFGVSIFFYGLLGAFDQV